MKTEEISLTPDVEITLMVQAVMVMIAMDHQMTAGHMVLRAQMAPMMRK